LKNLLLDEMNQRLLNHSNPPIIHCAGGVERTGTVIACYLVKYFIQSTNYNAESLAFDLTLYLRSQRSHLLHTAEQQKVLREFIQLTQSK